MRSEAEKLLPEALFDPPEVGRLPREGGPMYLAESRKPFSVVTAEEEVDALVGVEFQEFSDDLYGEDLRVGEPGRGSPASEALAFERVIHEAEDGDDEGVKIHFKKTSFSSVGLVATERREVFSLVQVLKETCTWG